MELPDQLACLDMAAALDGVGGDQELLKEIAGIFLDECPTALSEIRRAAESGDAGRLERAAHSLKGSIGPFAAHSAHEAAYRVEKMARSGELHAVSDALRDLESALLKLTPALSRLANS